MFVFTGFLLPYKVEDWVASGFFLDCFQYRKTHTHIPIKQEKLSVVSDEVCLGLVVPQGLGGGYIM